ncbi:MAG: MG2 domain-containing protein [Saprospiraceae bacterium]|nr:MG2 domain-containing protein [Saprospiraceae bacterium]
MNSFQLSFFGVSVLLLSFCCLGKVSAQPGYAPTWKLIEEMGEKGQYRAAREKLKELIDRSVQDNHPAQQVRATHGLFLLDAYYSEDGLLTALPDLALAAQEAAFPARAVLLSLLGQYYQQYLSDHLYELSDRTTLSAEPSADLASWTLADWSQVVHQTYAASLEDTRIWDVPLSDFSVLLDVPTDTRHQFPTLGDFLHYRAISHFSDERSYLTEPSYAFVLDQPEAFAPVSVFTKYAFPDRDSLSYKRKALQLYQQYLARLQEGSAPEHLVAVDLMRLAFAYENSSSEAKEVHYEKALQELFELHQGTVASAAVAAKLALFYHRKGETYQASPLEAIESLQTPARAAWKEAMRWCRYVLSFYPDTFSARQCRALQDQITQARMRLTAEEVYLPEKHALLKVAYRNLSGLDLVLLKTEPEFPLYDLKLPIRRHLNKQNYPVQARWSLELPASDDYQEHETEIAVEPLPVGHYTLVAIQQGSDSVYAAVSFSVSGLGLAHSNRSELFRQTVFVVDRSSGDPVEGAKLTLLRETAIAGTWTSDAEGLIHLPKELPSGYYTMVLEKGADRRQLHPRYLDVEEEVTYSGDPEPDYETRLFLDRAIYRPGQQVYFKGLVLETTKPNAPAIVTQREVVVSLIDPNGQALAQKTFITGDFGTFHGFFDLPQSGLLGEYSLRTESSWYGKSFRVEAYKRPTYEITFDAVEDLYQLGDSIEVSSVASAYSGQPVGDAQVVYQVRRNPAYVFRPWWFDVYISRFRQASSQVVASGTGITDASGYFRLNFPALAPPATGKYAPDAYDFEVVVTVTDISGETHTATKHISVGRSALEVRLEVPPHAFVGEPLRLSLDMRNSEGQAVALPADLEVYRLEAPLHVQVERLWPLPDQNLYSQDTFRQWFPHFAWGWEAFPALYPLREKVLAQTLSGRSDLLREVATDTWVPGQYKVLLHVALSDGDTLTTERFFTVSDLAAGNIASAQPALIPNPTGTFQPGDTVAFSFFSRNPGQRFFYLISNPDSLWLSGWQTALPAYTFRHPVMESDRGNVTAEGFYFRHNRVFNFAQEARVPWTNKQLAIEWHSFRDKLKPGERERWEISILDADGKPVAAELAATLYDASLDVFAPHDWPLQLYTAQGGRGLSNLRFDFNFLSSYYNSEYQGAAPVPYPSYPDYSPLPGIPSWYYRDFIAYALPAAAVRVNDPETFEEVSVMMKGMKAENLEAYNLASDEVSPEPDLENISLRENLNELVFFEPALRSDSTGRIVYEFVINEALTRWKLLALAHTPDLKLGSASRTIVTQKPLMVVPLAPRFLRTGDRMMLGAKISNQHETALSGNAGLSLVHALNGSSLDSLFGVTQKTKPFTCQPGESVWVEWEIEVPDNPDLVLQYDMVARAGNFSDGERNQIPILSNRTLITESQPVFLRPGQEKQLRTERLTEVQQSATFAMHRFSLEATPNPVWYAIQSLPYLNAYPFDCTEQLFNKLFAQRVGQGILEANPAIRAGVEARAKEGSTLLSPLQLRETLKMNILAETPWVLDAGGESQVAADLVKFLDVQQSNADMREIFDKIAERQLESGAFPWFPGGPESWHITQYLIEGFLRLDNMGLLQELDKGALVRMLEKAITYVDQSAEAYYAELRERAKKQRSGYLKQDHLSALMIHYLFVRTQADAWAPGKPGAAYDFFLAQAAKYWPKKGIYEMGLIAWTMQVKQREKVVREIMQALREQSFSSEEAGMYWKYTPGYFWYQDPIETQSFLISLFAETGAAPNELDDMRLWLLHNKRVKQWHSTRSTAAAVYALLYEGRDWVRPSGGVELEFPDAAPDVYQEQLDSARASAEAGTGYFSADWSAADFRPELGSSNWKNAGTSPAWGAVYWQYFEDFDKITSAAGTALQLGKSLYRLKSSDAGETGVPLEDGAALQPGDRLLVRLVIQTDRDMEYIHLKDTRAAGLEPGELLSGYEWRQGLGYYRQVRDTATDFFIEYLPRGKHVFEYQLVVTHKGDFSGGLTTIQSMYAPEFVAHTAGIRLSVR